METQPTRRQSHPPDLPAPMQTPAQTLTEGLRFAEVLATLKVMEARLEALEERQKLIEERHMAAMERLVSGLLMVKEIPE